MTHNEDEKKRTVVRCPVCRYDLRGLPTEHRCPECGMGFDKSMKTWRIGSPSRSMLGLAVFNVFAWSFFLISFLGSSGIRQMFAVTVTLLCAVLVFAGALWIRWRPCALLSNTSLATKGRFSWRFEVFQLADLDIVSREPLAVRVAADQGIGEYRQTVPLPTQWMMPQQVSEFCEEFFDRWRRCREVEDDPAAIASERGPP